MPPDLRQAAGTFGKMHGVCGRLFFGKQAMQQGPSSGTMQASSPTNCWRRCRNLGQHRTMRVPQPDIIEHFGNADAVLQPPERCLSRKGGIMRCCPKYPVGRDALIAPGRNVEIHGGRCKQMEFEHKKAAPGANLAPDTALHSISNYSLLIINAFPLFFPFRAKNLYKFRGRNLE